MDLILTSGCQNFEEYCLGVVMYLKYLWIMPRIKLEMSTGKII